MCYVPAASPRQASHDFRVEADPDDNKKDPLPDKSNVDLANVRVHQRADESNRRCVDLELLRYKVLGPGWQDCQGNSPAQQALRHLSDGAVASATSRTVPSPPTATTAAAAGSPRAMTVASPTPVVAWMHP